MPTDTLKSPSPKTDTRPDAKPGSDASTKTKRGPRYHLAELSRDDIIQSEGDQSLRTTYIGLSESVRQQSVDDLNQILVDTIMLRDMYKKHHWQLSGITFYQLHLLFDAHYEEQAELTDTIAERVQLLGGVSIGMPKDVAAHTSIANPPLGREDPAVQITRLIEAHQTILEFCHGAAKRSADDGDLRTNDMIVSNIMKHNEKQVWFLAEHLVPTTLQG